MSLHFSESRAIAEIERKWEESGRHDGRPPPGLVQSPSLWGSQPIRVSLVAQTVKNPPAMQETWV